MKLLAVDIEGEMFDSSQEYYTPDYKIYCLSVCDGETTISARWDTQPTKVEMLRRMMEDPSSIVAAHNARFDISVLQQKGWNVGWSRVWCTMYGEYLRDTRRVLPSLNSTGVLYGLGDKDDIDLTQYLRGQSLTKHQWEKLLHYNRRDTELCWNIAFTQLSKLKKYPETYKFYREVLMPQLGLLEQMQNEGLPLDPPTVNQLCKDVVALSKPPAFYSPGPTKYPGSIKRRDGIIYGVSYSDLKWLNPNSTQSIIDFLKSIEHPLPPTKTAKGNYSVDAEWLEESKDPRVQAVGQAKRALYLSKTVLPEFVRKKTLYGRIGIGVTRTGRRNSTSPNLQNIPVRSAIGRRVRECILAPEGWWLIDTDLAQQDARALALYLYEYCNYDALLDTFIRSHSDPSVDLHRENAINWGLGGNDEARSAAKTLIYAIIYGAGPSKVAATTGWTESYAKEVIASVLKRLPLNELKKDIWYEARRSGGWITTLTGSRLYYPEILSSDRGARARAERQVFNAHLQRCTGDVMAWCQVNSWDLFDDFHIPLLEVHDELLSMSTQPEEDAADLRKVFRGCPILHPVPCDSTPKWGKRWSEIH